MAIEDDLEKPFIGSHGKSSISIVLLSTLVAVCGSFQFGSCVGYSSPTQSAIIRDFNLSVSEFSMFGSILTIGAMIGAITSGKISDFIGRKRAMRLSAVFCIIGWLSVYFAKGARALDVGRFSAGYGIGIFSYVVPVFIAEIAPKHLRGGLATLNQLMIVCGSSVAYILGTFVTWRTLALTGLVPCILLLLGLFFIPESPRWLAKVGLEKEFGSALGKLRGKDADISSEAAEIQSSIDLLRDIPRTRIIDLFTARNIRPLIIGVGLMVLQQLGGINGIGFYSTQIFTQAGSASVAKIGTIVYATIQVPITIVGAMVMDKCGRRPLLMVSATGTCIGCAMTSASFYLRDGNSDLQWSAPMMGVSGVLVYVASFSIGMGAVPWVIMSEIFPIDVKGIGGSMVVLVNWLGAWLISFTFNFLMDWSSTGTFLMFAGFSGLTVLFVAIAVPETKGKTLEEIQASMDIKKEFCHTSVVG